MAKVQWKGLTREQKIARIETITGNPPVEKGGK